MLDRYSLEKIADGRGAEAVNDAIRNRLASQAAARGSKDGRAAPSVAGRTAGRLLAAALRALVLQSARPARAIAARGTVSLPDDRTP